MIGMKYFCSLLILSALLGQTAWAQVDTASFSIKVFAGADTEAPTTPVLLTATPLTSNQIDITWSAATDNYEVGGYVISRDSVAIATTTLLAYSDTGLTASTTYTYSVQAFDVSYNYSSSSNSLSTTTLEIIVPPTATTSEVESLRTESTATRVVLTDWRLETGYSTTSIFFSTKRPSRFELRWGQTNSYELGYVVSNTYASNHQINLSDLESGVTYYYELTGYTVNGFESVIKSGSFRTLSPAMVVMPANVNRFAALRNGTDVDLSWQLPTGTDISSVRIVRSHFGFPFSPSDGAIVYQGLGTAVTDKDILNEYSPVYYTAFVYDRLGNISSGAVAIVYALADSNSKPEEIYQGSEAIVKESQFSTEATSTINQAKVTPETKLPNQTDILVIQADRISSMFDTNIKLDSDENIIISIPVKSVSKNLKSIIVSLVDPTDNRQIYSYLLKINKDFTAYEATISALGVIGKSNLLVQIYDYEAFVVGTYQTPVIFVTSEQTSVAKTTPIFPDLIFKYSFYLFFLILLIIIIIILLFLIYKRREGEDKE